MPARIRLFLLLALAWPCGAMAADRQSSERFEAVLGDTLTVPNGLGVNIHFVVGNEAGLDRVKAAGFTLVRTDLLWSAVERQTGVYEWSGYDELVLNLRRRALVPLFILDYSNPLYTQRLAADAQPDAVAAAPVEPAARAAFAAFARQAALHFRGRVIWEIWNEPNLNFGHPIDPDGYIKLALAACGAIHSVDADAVVIGPAASRFAWSWLLAFTRADEGGCFKGLSVHPYRDATPPESLLADWSELRHRLAQDAPTDRIEPVNSEFGYYVGRRGVTEAEQASFLVRSYLLDLMAHIPITILYDWQNDSPDAGDPEANYGLLDYQGRPKAAYTAITDLIAGLRGLRLMGFMPAGRGDFVLVFGATDGSPAAIVGWTMNDHSSAVLPASTIVCTGLVETPVPANCRPDQALRVSLTPQTIQLTAQPQVFPLRRIAASKGAAPAGTAPR